MPDSSATPAPPTAPLVLPVCSRDGATFELLVVAPENPYRLLYWLPAMGMPARQYLPFAEALAARGVAVALHEWRGIGSSDRRAGHHDDWGYRELLLDDLPAGLAALQRRWPQLRCSVGGHSLGGQLAPLFAGLHPEGFDSLLLVASGAPYWRTFPHGWLIGLGLQLAPLLARACGHLPGRRLGFGGNEARGVVADWARSGRSGDYAAQGVAVDLEQVLGSVHLPLLALRLRDDWLGPAASLDWLLGKLGAAARTLQVLAPADLAGGPADHFSWMKAPQPIAARIADWLDALDAGSFRMESPDASV